MIGITYDYLDEENGDFYRLGYEARKDNYGIKACNLRALSAKRAWWLAGWHDRDMEEESE